MPESSLSLFLDRNKHIFKKLTISSNILNLLIYLSLAIALWNIISLDIGVFRIIDNPLYLLISFTLIITSFAFDVLAWHTILKLNKVDS